MSDWGSAVPGVAVVRPRRSALDEGLHERQSSTTSTQKHRPHAAARDQQPPLYQHPELLGGRAHRRRDIDLVGGVPSFYDDPLYVTFDYCIDDPVPYVVLPRLTEDDEYDDEAMLSSLLYRQWIGMPKIRTTAPTTTLPPPDVVTTATTSWEDYYGSSSNNNDDQKKNWNDYYDIHDDYYDSDMGV